MFLGKGYSFEVDIWSFGILLYELLTGYQPFSEEASGDPVMMQQQILDGQLKHPDIIQHHEIYSLINQMLQYDPASRPTISQIKES